LSAAKQEAFEEANRLKNQFRALDEDEIEFLDSVLESTRREEDRVKRETAEKLQSFRKQQEEADKRARGKEHGGGTGIAGDEEAVAEEEQTWGAAPGAARKRKRGREKETIKGLKRRRSSTEVETKENHQDKGKEKFNNPEREDAKPIVQKSPHTDKSSSASVKGKGVGNDPSENPTKSQTADKPSNNKEISKPSSGLVAYGSDDDDDW
jgi:FAM192A/Fyv6, N-terminal domain